MAPTATIDDGPPIDGYDRIAAHRLVPQLREHSQVELTSIDRYERSHRDRPPVLDKLRYLRGNEPFQGYDTLDSAGVLDAVADSDLSTLHAVRGYESKLRNREDVQGGVDRLRREKLAARNPGAPVAEPIVAWTAETDGGLKGVVMGVTVMGVIVVAAGLALISLFIAFFVIVATVAPNALD